MSIWLIGAKGMLGRVGGEIMELPRRKSRVRDEGEEDTDCLIK